MCRADYPVAPALRRVAFPQTKKRGRTAPFFSKIKSSGVQNPQLERLADRLGAVHDVELAQNLLHVVLDRERADLEDRADLEVALAQVDPLQDVLLAGGEHALARGLVEAAGAA